MNTKFLSFFRLILLAVIITQVTFVQAQDDYQTQMDVIFDIPAYKVTTGVLINRSPDIIDIMDFKLQPDSSSATVTNVINWFEMFYRIYSSHLNMSGFSYDTMLAHKYLGKTVEGQIHLGLIFYQFDKIKSNAVQNGLLTVDTVIQKVTDISPSGQTPLELDTCFAVSSLADTVATGTYDFILKDSLIVSNKQSDIQEIYVDFDNGQGYVRIYPNLPVTVSYSAIGNKTLTTKIVVASSVYYASSYLYVKNAPPQFAPVSTALIPMPDFMNFYDYNNITAWYGIWYRCNHDNTIHKPLLIVSGFDPQDRNRIGDEENGDDKVYLYNVANKDGFLNRLREMGYDIIIYRSANSAESIIPNAMNLVNFIKERINDVKTSDNELIVIVTSMGGLVCRYALTYMELPTNTFNHKTKLFISMDSPQNGANIPLGFQFLIKYMNQNLGGSVEMLNDAVNNMLGSDAAKEMLIYHYLNTSGLTARCATNRTDFLNSLSSIGGFPQECLTMAVSMGSGNGTNQGFSAGASLIKKNPSPIVLGAYWTLDLLLSLFGIPPIVGPVLGSSAWEFEVRAVPNQTRGEIYREELYLRIGIPTLVWYGIVPVIELRYTPHFINRKEEVNNTQPLDNAPGSIIGLHNLTSFETKGLETVFSSLGIINIDPHFDCFIPAYSALGLDVAPHTNIKTYLNTCSGVTQMNSNLFFNTNKSVSPFDYLYIENANIDHIFDDNKEGVMSEAMLMAMDGMVGSSQLNLGDKTILSGQSVAYEAEHITVNGNFIIESGGSLKMRAKGISLGPGFLAEAGSMVSIIADSSWICPAGSIQTVSFSPLVNLVWEDVLEFQTAPFEKELPTLLTTQDNTANEIRFFPNPVEKILNLQIVNSIEGEIKLTIINANGQIVHSQIIMNNIINTVDFSRFSAGVYFVHIAFKDNMRAIKIIKK